MNDNVNHPAHYTSGSIECIDAIQAALTPEEFRGFCKGNAIKYAYRERMKGGNESLQKANWYLAKAVSVSSPPAPATQAGGWVEWEGKGPRPVKPDAAVEVLFRNGAEEIDEAGALNWSHTGDLSDVIAYRIIKE